MAAFPSLLPRPTDDLWFCLEKRLDDDAILVKEEEEYAAYLEDIVKKGKDIVPIGKTKEQPEAVEEEEEEELEDEEDSAEELEEETDEYESPPSSPSPGPESVEGEVEMMDLSFM
ncbi:predicted protein [Nematostella vectensis]|uniref:Uncharacterized protein n=1 Tax=Nematostella vectensis TaxID=45351 RepID=A7SLK8_NEMVE|nr:anaphase-promoting complex subunit 15B [Nematostella vectensis]EDO35426.1 predicted protein [Nematostella vectensis]|eukprot:XP_001627526.1 predicted protein [Nematostella vectensis]